LGERGGWVGGEGAQGIDAFRGGGGSGVGGEMAVWLSGGGVARAACGAIGVELDRRLGGGR
jgi:hypothetical protein